MVLEILPLTKIKVQILSALYVRPELNLIGISKEIGVPSSNILKVLIGLGPILDIRDLGKIKLYSIKKNYLYLFEPIIERYRLEVSLGKNIALLEMIKDISYIFEIYVFGSYAKGTMNENSDLDLIVITEDEDLVEKELKNIKKISPISLEIVYMTLDKFESELKLKNSKFYSIISNKNQRIKF